MIQFKNIRISKQVIENGMPLPFIYFEDELGRDWYTLRDETWNGDTAFIAVSDDGFIATGARNPNFMTLMEGVSIYEINAEDYRDDIGTAIYRFEQGEIIAYTVPASEVAEREKNVRMVEANVAIAPLQDAVELSMATDEETNALTAWKKYRVLLSRIDTSKAPDIVWPTKPVVG
jgi:uncharacterized protein (DUF1499 family)